MTTASSCTAGLAAALIALDARGAILFPAFTFPATPAAIVMAGNVPAMLDVSPETWAMAPENLERALRTERYAAVMLVAPFGLAQDFREHFDICQRAGIPVVIDNAAGLGGPLQALPDGHSLEVYSMHATKVFAIGEGGLIRSRANQAGALRRALNFGLEQGSAIAGSWGINGKLPEVSGAIGLEVLEGMAALLAVRRSIAQEYVRIFSGCPGLKFPADTKAAPWQTFPVLFPTVDQSERFLRALNDRGVEGRRYYGTGLEEWRQTKKVDDCRHARTLSAKMICLPVYSDLSESEASVLFSAVADGLGDSLA